MFVQFLAHPVCVLTKCFAGPLAGALLEGVSKRFGVFEAKGDMIVASVSHSQFKLRRIQNEVDRIRVEP